MKLQSVLLKTNFVSITQFCYIYYLMPHQNTSYSPVLHHFKQCISQVTFFYGLISLLSFQNTQQEQKYFPSMPNITVATINVSYIQQGKRSHNKAVYVTSKRGKVIPAVYIRLKLISGRKYLSFTNGDIGLLRGKSVQSIKCNV